MRGKPTYDLQYLQQLVGQGPLSRIVTEIARAGADYLGWGVPEIVAAVLELGPNDFHKSMEALKCPGLWQDVYHLEFRGVELYIKLQVSPDGRATVIQFKKR